MASYIHIVLFLLVATKSSIALHDDDVTRIESEVDESSCICGLNKGILDRLESFIHLGASVCLANQVNQPVKAEQSKPVAEDGQNTVARDPSETNSLKPTENKLDNKDHHNESNKVEQQVNSISSQSADDNTTGSSIKTNPEAILGSSSTVKPDQTSLNNQASSNVELMNNEKLLVNYISKLSSEISWLQTQLATMTPPLQGSQPNAQTATQAIVQSSLPTHESNLQSSSNSESKLPNIVTSNKIEAKPTWGEVGSYTIPITTNEASAKLNQSQIIETQVVENALQSTVPNMVSSIFTSMQKLEIQAQKNQNGSQKTGSSESGSGGKLTSIDGSSIELQKGDSTEQITASGERLFLRWIEHQLENLHLTASVANYIRKSSVNMFRRIVKQYVEHMEKLGGSVNENVRRATQMALDNAQTMSSFLLKNYINFAGGLMQIIGEQVSRVGKQIDSTGGAIAHFSLNPFDIVSNVFDSLPNPSDYSKYFRAFGKQLLGESTTNTPPLNTNSANSELEQENDLSNKKQVEQPDTDKKQQNIITKTMGALSKLFG